MNDKEARARATAILDREDSEREADLEYRRVRNPLYVEARELAGIYQRLLNGYGITRAERGWLKRRGPRYGFGA